MGVSAHALDYSFFEQTFIDKDILSAQETQFFDQAISTGQITDLPGSYAVIYPDDRTPLIGAAAQDAFKDGSVRIMSFSGLPCSFAGSISWGKVIAQINNEPVFAVHSGYNDMGVYTEGPVSFFVEREYNKYLTPYLDVILTVPYNLLNNANLPQREITLIGGSSGVYKIANLVNWLRA